MSNLNIQFTDFLTQNNLSNTNKNWLVAVSGGVDSIVLCHLCYSNKIPFTMAHCNFQLRGEESERDEAFVHQFAAQLNVELLVKRFDTKKYAADKNISIQVAARELRYNWFEEIVKEGRSKNEIVKEGRSENEIVKEGRSEKAENVEKSSRFTSHDSRFTTDDSRFTTHDSGLTTDDSRFTSPDSRLTTDDSRLTTDDSRLTSHDSRLTTDDSRLTSHDSRLTTHDSRFTTDDSQFTTHDSRFTSHVSLLATAHHADDNLETVFFNMFRGTGIRGLRGILPVQGHIIRPMLNMHKPEILEYATINGLGWVEDSSNASDKYSRNFIRNQILPMIKEILPAAEKNVVKSLDQLREAEMLYEQAIELHKKKLLELKGNEVHIPILKLAKAKPLNAILFEILKPYNFTAAQTQGAEALMDSETGSFIVSNTYRIFKNRNWLIIAPLQTELAQHILIEKGEGKIKFPEGILELKSIVNSQSSILDDVLLGQLDAKHITFPIILRPWKIGDYFYPLGMQKKKKLSKFFIDKKMSKTDKEKIWVIESNKKILWVVGHRIDDRFKLTESTKYMLELRFKPNIIA